MKQFIKISIIVLVIGVLGYFAYTLIMRWHEDAVETARQEVHRELSPPVPEEKLIEAFGEVPAEVPGEEKKVTFEEIQRQTMAFFSYLDLQDYISDYNLQNGTYLEFIQVTDTLTSNPPVITGETESVFTLMKNMSHLYRVLGKERIDLAKDILKNESAIIESVMKTFYEWFTTKDITGEQPKGRPSLKVLYEYSAFFLNTISGRNYLLRRDPKVRILTSYYCVLILDRANDARLNPYGIDIRPHIDSLLTDISNRTGLIHKQHYLSELEKLKEKYQI